MALNFFMRRDFRLAALFLWMTPFSAALSKALIAALTAAAAWSERRAISFSAFLIRVLARERIGLLYSLRLWATLRALSADLVLGNPFTSS